MDPPPTAQPCRITTCLKYSMLKKPRRAKRGRQNQRQISQLVEGRLSGVQRRPISITATRYPFSVSRWAVTLPPKPEPITMKSKSRLESDITVSLYEGHTRWYLVASQLSAISFQRSAFSFPSRAC